MKGCGKTINILIGANLVCGKTYDGEMFFCRKCQNIKDTKVTLDNVKAVDEWARDATITVNHPGPFYCPECSARMADRGNDTVKCLMMTCKSYGISWDLPKVILTKTVEVKS